MGYYMDQRDCKFTIKAENIDKAWEALRDLFLKEEKSIYDAGGYHYAWINTDDVLEADSFQEAMGNARWDVYKNSDGDINNICFCGEKKGGDEEVILGSIAPYVENGSYIEMEGEDGIVWRWCFDDGMIYEKYPTIIWD